GGTWAVAAVVIGHVDLRAGALGDLPAWRGVDERLHVVGATAVLEPVRLRADQSDRPQLLGVEREDARVLEQGDPALLDLLRDAGVPELVYLAVVVGVSGAVEEAEREHGAQQSPYV